jgi:hypothetical protein
VHQVVRITKRDVSIVLHKTVCPSQDQETGKACEKDDLEGAIAGSGEMTAEVRVHLFSQEISPQSNTQPNYGI